MPQDTTTHLHLFSSNAISSLFFKFLCLNLTLSEIKHSFLAFISLPPLDLPPSLISYLNKFYCEDTLSVSNYPLSPLPTYFVPDNGSLNSFR